MSLNFTFVSSISFQSDSQLDFHEVDVGVFPGSLFDLMVKVPSLSSCRVTLSQGLYDAVEWGHADVPLPGAEVWAAFNASGGDASSSWNALYPLITGLFSLSSDEQYHNPYSVVDSIDVVGM